MTDVGKLINLGNLLVRKVTWLVLKPTSVTLIFPAHLEPTAWQRLPIYTLVFQELILFHSDFQRQHCRSLHCDLQWQYTLSLTFGLPAVNPTKIYSFYNLFLSCSTFLVRPLQASNTASEISSNPERDNQPTCKKTRSSSHALLYFYISIPCMKYLAQIHVIVYRTLSIFRLFSIISVLVYAHTEEYSKDSS